MGYYTFGLGADDPCLPCYDAKSEQYRGCQAHPAGSAARETCFRQADANLGTCLQACKPGSASAGGTLLLLGVGIAAIALLA